MCPKYPLTGCGPGLTCFHHVAMVSLMSYSMAFLYQHYLFVCLFTFFFQALLQAGAHVPDSFDTLGTIIR